MSKCEILPLALLILNVWLMLMVIDRDHAIKKLRKERDDDKPRI
jgi:hypothetical protein